MNYERRERMINEMAMFKFSVDKSEFVGQMARVSERNF